MVPQEKPGHHGNKPSINTEMVAGRVDYFKTVSSQYRNSAVHLIMH